MVAPTCRTASVSSLPTVPMTLCLLLLAINCTEAPFNVHQNDLGMSNWTGIDGEDPRPYATQIRYKLMGGFWSHSNDLVTGAGTTADGRGGDTPAPGTMRPPSSASGTASGATTPTSRHASVSRGHKCLGNASDIFDSRAAVSRPTSTCTAGGGDREKLRP